MAVLEVKELTKKYGEGDSEVIALVTKHITVVISDVASAIAKIPAIVLFLFTFILGSSPHLPVSVCGTGTYIQYSQAFLASVLLENSLLYFHYIFRYESFLFLAYLPLLCHLCLLSIT